MSARELFKEIEIENAEGSPDLYRVRKMDAFTGTALLKTLLAKFLPVVQMAQGFYEENMHNIGGDPTEEQQELMNREAVKLIMKVAPPLLEELSDDEVYLLDLESRVGELSDEEAA